MRTCTISTNIVISPHSLPKVRKSTISREFNIFIAPYAKFSALEIEYIVCNYNTKSTPHFKAISVFVHLLTIEGSPL